MAEFEARVRSRGEVEVIELRGQLDGSAAASMADALDQVVAATPAVLVLEFEHVSYINSTGIALIVGALGRVRSLATEVRVCGLSEHYRHIFEITRLSDFMRFFPDEDAAVGDVQPVG
jgi:anti-sigma B factor antagonist